MPNLAIEVKWKVPNTPLHSPPKARKLFDKEILRSLNLATEIVATQARFQAPRGAIGHLWESINTEVQRRRGLVYVGAKYGLVIEYGRKAKPVAASAIPSLTAWVRLSTKGRKYFAALQKRYPRVTVAGAVYLLRRSMKRRARKPNPFMHRAYRKSRPFLKKERARLAERLANGMVRE